MKTQGEIEAAICKGMSHFEQEYMGRGPKDIRAHLIGDLLVVRLQGVLTAAEQHLVQTLPVEKGRDLLKQVRSQLIEVARPKLDALVEDITGSQTPEPAPRHQHPHGRRDRGFYAGRGALLSRSEEEVARSSAAGPFPSRK